MSKSKSAILDDLTQIRKVDESDMLSFCLYAYKHYEKAARLARTFSLSCREPQTIIAAGVGGSAIGGDLLKDWSRNRIAVPIEVCREYSLPEYANKNTLVFVVSYSGETEESLSVFLEAIERKCMVACISSGGKLSEFAEKLSLPLLRVPSGMPPRATLPYLFVPLALLMEKMNLATGVSTEISETVKILKHIRDENSPDEPLKGNLSKSLASRISGTIPFVYGFGAFRAVAQRFKTQLNENSKVPAKWEVFPELDHNEIVGWEGAHELAECCSVIFLRDRNEEKGMKERIEVTEELLQSVPVRTFAVCSKGESTLARMSSLISIGDFVSVYLAVLRGIDPTPVKTIDLLKDKIKQSGLKDKIVQELQNFVKQ
ncbi:MAG: bifunctional phosphoglucose/phosphomannose isomerase [Candidatus Bathyarchaeia archaeon]